MAKDIWLGDVVIRDGQAFSEAPPTVSEYLESGGATGGSRIARLRARQEAERRAEQARLAEQTRRLEEAYRKRQAEEAEKERRRQEAEEKERRNQERLERERIEMETAREREQRLYLLEQQRKEEAARSRVAVSESGIRKLEEKSKEKTKFGFPTKEAIKAKEALGKIGTRLIFEEKTQQVEIPRETVEETKEVSIKDIIIEKVPFLEKVRGSKYAQKLRDWNKPTIPKTKEKRVFSIAEVEAADVSYVQTFFPSRKLKEGEVTLQTKAEAIYLKKLRNIDKAVNKIIPAKYSKIALFPASLIIEKAEPLKITEITKFGLFSPYFKTTTQTKAEAIAKENIKPTESVQTGKVTILEGDKYSSVVLKTEKTFGGTYKIKGASAQILQKQADDIVIGGGKGFVLERTGAGVHKVSEFTIAGKAAKLGDLEAVYTIPTKVTFGGAVSPAEFEISQKVATSFAAQTLSQPQGSMTSREAIGLYKKFKFSPPLKTTEIKVDKLGLFRRTEVPIKETQLTGFYTPTGKKTFEILAQTDDVVNIAKMEYLTPDIYLTGKKITESQLPPTRVIDARTRIDVSAQANLGQIQTPTPTLDMVKQKLTQKFLTKSLQPSTKEVESVFSQTATLESAYKQAFLKTAEKTSTKLSGASALTKTPPRIKYNQGQINIPIEKTRHILPQKQMSKSVPIQKPKLKQFMPQDIRTGQKEFERQRQRPILKQMQTQAQAQLQKQKVIQTPSFKTPPVIVPELTTKDPPPTTKIPIVLPKIKTPRLTTRTRRTKPLRESYYYSPSFTARVANIKAPIGKINLRPMQPITIRPIPLFKRRRKKKR